MADPFAGMQSGFASSLHQLMSAVRAQGGDLTVASGFRDGNEQQQLYNKAVATYGQANAVNWAAKPGTSNHEKGLAADIHGDSKSMALAHNLAASYGLNFPLSNEAWHIEPTGTSQMHDNQGGPAAVTDNGQNTALDRVNVLLNAITGGKAGLGGSGTYTPAADATHTSTTMNDSVGPTAWDAAFQSAGAQYGISPALLKAVAKTESGFDPNATSGAGAQGMMQFMPATAKSLGVNPMDPVSAINGAAKMLSGLMQKFHSPELALAAYNAGAGAVEKYNGIPPFPETQNYVHKVMRTVSA